MSQPPVFPEVSVVGMHFRVREGIPAYDIIAAREVGDHFLLEREPTNAFDSFAIKVLDEPTSTHIGYIEAGQACFISSWIDEGHTYLAQITSFTERQRGGLTPIVKCYPIGSAEISSGEERVEPISEEA